MSGLFTPSVSYKPFRYPWAYEAWLSHEQMHWLFEEVPLADDVRDWNHKLTAAEQNLMTQIFRLFTQSDVEVENAYLDLYMPKFKPTEIRMMLSGFAAREAMHQASYSYLLDTVGMPEVEYSAFLDYQEMSDKCDYLKKFNLDTPHNTALSMAVFGAFTEGLQLFASFAILLNFPRHNKLKGMGQIVSWSVKDEGAHVDAVIRLYHTLLEETPEIDRNVLDQDVIGACHDIVRNEDAFIDLAFEMGAVEGLTPDEVKRYIRFIANVRMRQLNLPEQFDVPENPLPWIDHMINAVEHANFFEQRSIEYSKAATSGAWDDDIF